jgi:acyl-CoA thioesterase
MRRRVAYDEKGRPMWLELTAEYPDERDILKYILDHLADFYDLAQSELLHSEVDSVIDAIKHKANKGEYRPTA